MYCIDHCIVTENVFDSIVSNNVIVDPTNPSNHNSMRSHISMRIHI